MKYLQIVSIFPALTETFVLRDARKMRQIGCDVFIGQLRPTGRRPTSSEFEDLRPFVVPANLLSLSGAAAILLFTFRKPKHIWECLRLVLGCFPDVINMLKLLYILLASMALAHRLRKSGISHVRGHHLHSEAVASMFVARLLDLPYSFKCYTAKIYYPRHIVVEVIREAAFIIADTLQVREFLNDLGGDPRRMHIVRNAVDLRDFPVRKQESLSNPPIILAVGRLDYKKGFHLLLSACAILRDEGLPFRCAIIGDGDEWSRLLVQRRELGLEEQIEMLGSLGFSDVQRWYEQAALLAMPSVVAPDGSTDGLPTVVIEAFTRGVPVVGSSTAGIPEVIQHGVNGFVVPAGSPNELASRMKELLLNEALCRKFAAEARRTAERDFDLDRNLRIVARLMFGQIMEQPSIAKSIVLDHALRI